MIEAIRNPVAWARGKFETAANGMPVYPLVILFFVYFFDEFDTAAFATLVPEIREAFDLTRDEFATIVVLNLSVVLLAAIPLGYYGDRLPRSRLVVAGAVIAGVFSFLTGAATASSVLLLVIMRLGNGFGIIVNDPIHTSLLSDYYKPIDRPAVFTLHRNAVRVGGVLGPAVAGFMTYFFGWRAAFMVLIAPILLMAFFALRLTNPVRGATEDEDSAEAAAAERPVKFGRAVRMLFAVKTLRRQYLSWVFIGAAFLPLAFLLPLLWEEEFNLGPFERGALGSLTAAAGFAGVLLAGRWTVGWLAKGMGEPLKRAGWVLVAVGPGLLLLSVSQTLLLAVPIAVLTTFVGGMFTPAFITTQAFVSPARIRSLSFSFGLLFIVVGLWMWILLGFAAIGDNHGNRWAIAALLPFWVIGGLILRSGHKFVAADTTRALNILVMTAEQRKRRLQTTGRSILVCQGVDVSYGPVQVLFGVDFELAEGEIVALLGTNGAGKSTLLKTISGLVPMQAGAIFFDGEDITGLEPEDSFALGLVQVPGGRGIFPSLTVKENLDIAAWATRRPKDEVQAAVQEVLDLFPALVRRIEQPAGVLSGGEQQMLTLGQAFIAQPKLLMIDELSLGLAPIVVEELLKIVRRIHDSGTSVILVEQSVNLALTVASRAVFMEKGEVRFSGPTSELLERDDILRAVFLTGSGALKVTK